MQPHDTPCPTRHCKSCDKDLPLSEWGKGTSNKDGLQSYCKQCMSARTRARYVPHPRIVQPTLPGFAPCCRCKAVKVEAEFNKNKHRKNGLQSICRECQKAYSKIDAARHPDRQKAHYEANREAIIAHVGEWQKANRDKCNENSKRHYNRHKRNTRKCALSQRPEFADYIANLRASKKRLHNLGNSLSRKRNPEKHCQNQSRRRALKYKTQIGKVDYEAILLRHGFVCHICGGDIPRDRLHFDHVIPLSKGGPHTEDNIRPSHASCNIRKSNKLLYPTEE